MQSHVKIIIEGEWTTVGIPLESGELVVTYTVVVNFKWDLRYSSSSILFIVCLTHFFLQLYLLRLLWLW